MTNCSHTFAYWSVVPPSHCPRRGACRVGERCPWRPTPDRGRIRLTHRKGNGVCQHSDLGMPGGGHVDCGHGYPIDFVIKRARVIRKAKYGH